MAVIAFTSIAGTPGVTAATLAAAVHWPRPVLVLEADTNNVGSMLSGFFRSNLDTDLGMQKVSLAQSRSALTTAALVDDGFKISIAVHALQPIPEMPLPSIPAGHRMWVIPGYLELQTVDGVTSTWSRLPAVFRELDIRGIDVLVDLGRLGRNDARLPILDGADQVVILASSTMNDLNRLDKRLRLPDLADRVSGLGATKYSVLVTKAPYEAVTTDTFSLVLPVLGAVDFDPAGAAVFALGREDKKPKDNRYRVGIHRAVASLDQRLANARSDRRAS